MTKMFDKQTEVYKFKRGDVTTLDHIYHIQGLAGGDWWDHKDGEVYHDDVVITKTITITIKAEVTRNA